MKYALLLTATMLSILPAAFGMLEEQNDTPKTITIVAHLGNSKKLDQEYLKGSFDVIPEGYEYNYRTHSISFPVSLEEAKKSSTFKFNIVSLPTWEDNPFKHIYYDHLFGCTIPDTTENNREVQATLLSTVEIKFGYRMVGYIALRDPFSTVIYKNEDIKSWKKVSSLTKNEKDYKTVGYIAKLIEKSQEKSH